MNPCASLCGAEGTKYEDFLQNASQNLRNYFILPLLRSNTSCQRQGHANDFSQILFKSIKPSCPPTLYITASLTEALPASVGRNSKVACSNAP